MQIAGGIGRLVVYAAIPIATGRHRSIQLRSRNPLLGNLRLARFPKLVQPSRKFKSSCLRRPAPTRPRDRR